MSKKEIMINSAKLVTPKGRNKDGWNVAINYTERTKEGTNTVTYVGTAQPHPDFVDAIKGLTGHLAALTEQYNSEGKLDIDNIETRGLHFRGEDEKEGVTVTGVRRLSNNRAIVLNTPFLRWNNDEAYNDMDNLNEAAMKAIDEAQAYLMDGKHAPDSQGSLFPEADEETHEG